MLKIEPRVLYMLSKCSASELSPQTKYVVVAALFRFYGETFFPLSGKR